MPDADCLYAEQLPGRTLHVNGAEYLYCSGTSYLGISQNEVFRERLLEGMARYGTNYSSSRNSNLQLQVFDEAEDFLAAYTGAEAALTLSSGLLAGQVLVQVLQGSAPFLYAPGTHPAVWRSTADAPNARQPFQAWADQLLQVVAGMPEQHIIIVCNSLDPLQARNHSFAWVAGLPPQKQFTLIIDDSHGFGVTGTDGAGVYSQVPEVPHVRLIVVSSFGKAFGVPAGVILGERQLITRLRSSPFVGGASPAVPAYLYAFLHSQDVYSAARQRLFANITGFGQQLDRPELFRSFDYYPVFNTASHVLCPYLQQNRVLISSFRYPTPADDPVTRVVLNSLHTPEDLQRLTHLINKFAPA